MTDLTPTYCYAHPGRETGLRCKRCERPICATCAQRTATGYLCKDCVQAHQKKFDTALWSDYLIVFFTASILSGLAAFATMLITAVVWGFFIIFLAPLAGTMIANAARYFVKNHRSPALNYTLAGGIVAGALPIIIIFSALPVLSLWFLGGNSGENLIGAFYMFSPLIWQIVYLVLAIPAAYGQFSGLFFKR